MTIPKVTYCDPEIASVGLGTDAAKGAGHDVETVTYPLGGNGRSIIRGTTGSVTLVRAKDGPVLGVHMVGLGVSELISEAQLAVGWEAHPEDIAPWSTPTRARARPSARRPCLLPGGRCTRTPDPARAAARRTHPDARRPSLVRTPFSDPGET